MDLSNFESLVNKHLSAIKFPTSPKNLYEPIEYFISIGGKRVRPIASLITFSLFKEINADIINASLAIEIFHNFTLAHDDIMDDSKYRRGKLGNPIFSYHSSTFGEDSELPKVLQSPNQCSLTCFLIEEAFPFQNLLPLN